MIIKEGINGGKDREDRFIKIGFLKENKIGGIKREKGGNIGENIIFIRGDKHRFPKNIIREDIIIGFHIKFKYKLIYI